MGVIGDNLQRLEQAAHARPRGAMQPRNDSGKLRAAQNYTPPCPDSNGIIQGALRMKTGLACPEGGEAWHPWVTHVPARR